MGRGGGIKTAQPAIRRSVKTEDPLLPPEYTEVLKYLNKTKGGNSESGDLVTRSDKKVRKNFQTYVDKAKINIRLYSGEFRKVLESGEYKNFHQTGVSN